MIHTWESYFDENWTLEQHAEHHKNGMLEADPPAPGLSTDAQAVARVSGSCWIADCPRPGCGGAEFVNFADPRFFCCNCRNVDWSNQPIEVILPDEQLKADVEQVLLERPIPETRNWAEGETVADLEAENAEADVG